MYENNLGRRRVLVAATGVAVGALAGCLGDDDTPEPIALDDGQSCDQCGMVIEEHPGPTGQIFFEDYPDDREGPAHFCSGTCTYQYRFDAEDAGQTPIVTYLTDYSGVDYSLTDDEEQPFISAHLGPDDYADETGMTFAAGSDVHGAMGPDLIPFGDDDDAATFADEHGGDVVTHDEINRDLLDAMAN